MEESKSTKAHSISGFGWLLPAVSLSEPGLGSCGPYLAIALSRTTSCLPHSISLRFETMLCEACRQREATVHLTTTFHLGGPGREPGATQKQHFCVDCADEYFAHTPGKNWMRKLICLSDSYRSKLYDQLEKRHPEAFDNSTTEACRRGSELMRTFLREQLKQDGIEVNEDAFEKLGSDLFGSHHFYTRSDQFKKRKGQQ
jgi:hypothetical protein